VARDPIPGGRSAHHSLVAASRGADNPRVPPRAAEPGSAPERRFFLARSPRPPSDGRAELIEEDARHAQRVLRLGVGDRLVGLDGRGGIWPAEVSAVARDRVEVLVGPGGRIDPAPGAPGAALPWIEIAVAWPKPGKLEEMLDRLTQLGAAAIARLPSERAGPHAQDPSGARRARLERVLREACKQSGRSWLPVLADEPAGGEAELVLLDPDAGCTLPAWIARVEHGWTAARPLRVLVGPEGGFTAAERAQWIARGAEPLALGPHVLRVETAAEAAMATIAACSFTPRRT